MRAYDAQRLRTALRAVAPPLFFGFRLWASVCLALCKSMVWGDSTAAVSRLAVLDKTPATRSDAAALRARGSIIAMSEALSQHADYFDAGGFR